MPSWTHQNDFPWFAGKMVFYIYDVQTKSDVTNLTNTRLYAALPHKNWHIKTELIEIQMTRICLPTLSCAWLCCDMMRLCRAARKAAALRPHRPWLCRMRLCRDIVCHTVAGTHAGTYVPRLVLGLCTESDCFSRLNVDIFKLLSIVNWTVSKHERADDEMRFLWTLLVLVTLRWCDEVVAWCYTNKSMCSANQLHFFNCIYKTFENTVWLLLFIE